MSERPAQLEHSNEKEPVPQLDEVTGLSHDYSNEFSWAHMYDPSATPQEEEEEFKFLIDQKAAKYGTPIRTYTDVYPTDRFLDVLNDKNQHGFEQIEVVRHQVEALYSDGKLDRETFLRLTKQIAYIIYEKPPKGYRSP